jgi:hypothetical protein
MSTRPLANVRFSPKATEVLRCQGFHELLRRFNARAGCVQEVIARWVWMALNDCGRMLRSCIGLEINGYLPAEF